MLTKFFISLVTLSVTLILSACRETITPPNPPKYVQNIFLSAVDTSVTELTLKVAIAESVEQRAFIVKRDTQTILSALCSALDTTVTDTALLPNHNYTYKAYRLKNNVAIDSSQTLTITTRTYSPLVLSVLDTGINDATLKIAINDNSTNRQYQLTRNGQLVTAGYVNGNDTTLIETQLAPLTTYTYTAYRIANGQVIDTSNTIQLTTQDDTTSHNFTWQIDTLGDGASSGLSDVFIFDENNVWAVGEMYLRDSTGGFDPRAYNVAKWNGINWTLERITVLYHGNLITPPLEGIFAFSPTDIWVSSGVPIHWDGQNWTLYHLFDMGVLGQNDGSVSKLWGTSSQNIYFVGRNGTVVHYNGTTWHKIESGTNLEVYDIYGDWNANINDYEIYAVAAQLDVSFEKKIFKVTSANVSPLSTNGIPYSIEGIWFKSDQFYYTVGAWQYSKKIITSSAAWNPLNVTQYYTYAIRGNQVNDIVLCGAFGEIQHFNGRTWKSFRSTTSITYGNLYRLAIRNNLVVAVGEEYPRAIIVRGKRR
jgi:hypothetical protein